MIRAGLVGWPIGHSRSPVIFSHWFERYGIDGRYDLFPVPPDGVDRFFADLPDTDITGCNVTVPHKQAAARNVTADPVGQRLGSVNTVWRNGTGLAGTSSDGFGFLASLDADAPGWRGASTAVLLGAGGAAVAVADALVTAGLTLVISNRTPAKADALAARVGATAIGWDALPAALPSARLLVNTTSAGMAGTAPVVIDLDPLPAAAVVADIVYNPLETPLLAAARARGLATVDGLGMLLWQATVGFERWFGLVPEVDASLRRRVLATL